MQKVSAKIPNLHKEYLEFCVNKVSITVTSGKPVIRKEL